MSMIESLEGMLAKGQDNALLRYGLGNEYLKVDDFTRAAPHFQKAVEHDPKYSAAWKLLGKSLAGAGRKAEAVAAYESGIAVAESKGDIQAAKEMRVFLKRLHKSASDKL